MQNTTALLKNDFLKANVALEVIHAETPIELNIDYQLIEQVLINILKNALEVVENKENAKVKLETSVQGELVTVSISDNGAGITPEATEKIFMPFFSTKNRGSGIGLSLSKQIMQLHGGDIQLETELGKGASFKMVFHQE